jgi:2-amino-4-hydroxy-6-hydroxymethyldihydropteridine diphosphokinase
MTWVYVSLGSNVNRQKHIDNALQGLNQHFTQLVISPVYETTAVGFDGDDFYNLVVGFESELDLGQLHALLRQIEDDNERDRNMPKFSARTLDIDILTFGQTILHTEKYDIPRQEITKMAFVLQPLVDIAAEKIHPELKLSYQQLWNDFNSNSQKLKKVVNFNE